jgi:hypothetical protein
VFSVYERRRIVVLGLVTLLVVGAIRLIGGQSDAVVGDQTSTSSTRAPEGEIPEPVILGGPSPLAPTGSAIIAYPAESPSSIDGLATFSNLGYTQTPVCYSTVAPIGMEITITNVNNGRKIRCTNVYSVLVPYGMSVLMHSSLFVEIANLIDAPLPVRISW